jgi:hypothetical protein
LISNSVWADNQADGQIRLNVTGGPLWYILDGYGDTFYRGSPSEMIEVSRIGQGELIELD